MRASGSRRNLRRTRSGDFQIADPPLRRRRARFWKRGGSDVRARGKLGATRERDRRFGNRRSLSAAITGTLNIARPTGFIPSVSDAFPILTYANGHTGTTAGPRTFTPAYNATNLTLNVT